MIPSVNGSLAVNLETQTQPGRTYMMHIERDRISGYCDKREAVKQAIYKILNTERYQYVIYSRNYGISLLDLYGEPIEYVCPELQRRIEDALSVDDRIESCEDFEFDTSERRNVIVTFTAKTIYGDVEAEKAVSI